MHVQVQQMMKVKSEREDLHQENSKLHSEMRKLQRDLDGRAAQADQKLQEQLQTLKSDNTALQEQLQQQQAQRAAPAAPAPLQTGLKKEGQEQGYTNTWKLVDQLRNQNRCNSSSMIECTASVCRSRQKLNIGKTCLQSFAFMLDLSNLLCLNAVQICKSINERLIYCFMS